MGEPESGSAKRGVHFFQEVNLPPVHWILTNQTGHAVHHADNDLFITKT